MRYKYDSYDYEEAEKYFYGKGVDKDIKKAIYYYEHAINFISMDETRIIDLDIFDKNYVNDEKRKLLRIKNNSVLFKLVEIYIRGIEVERDLQSAYYLLSDQSAKYFWHKRKDLQEVIYEYTVDSNKDLYKAMVLMFFYQTIELWGKFDVFFKITVELVKKNNKLERNELKREFNYKIYNLRNKCDWVLRVMLVSIYGRIKICIQRRSYLYKNTISLICEYLIDLNDEINKDTLIIGKISVIVAKIYYIFREKLVGSNFCKLYLNEDNFVSFIDYVRTTLKLDLKIAFKPEFLNEVKNIEDEYTFFDYLMSPKINSNSNEYNYVFSKVLDLFNAVLKNKKQKKIKFS